MSLSTNHPEFRNELLSRLNAEDLDLLRPDLEPVQLDLKQMLEHPNQPISHVYFPCEGLASIVASDASDRRSEIGIVGREGMTGLAVVLGNGQSPHETFMQLPGNGYRLSVEALWSAIAKSESLRRLLLCYVHALTIQMSHTALANSKVKLEARLARWLLMAHDRVDGSTVGLTHEFLALMLGVRRAGVTQALQNLEGKKLIRAARGRVNILNRKGLERLANSSYGVPEAEYRRLMAENSLSCRTVQ